MGLDRAMEVRERVEPELYCVRASDAAERAEHGSRAEDVFAPAEKSRGPHRASPVRQPDAGGPAHRCLKAHRCL
jgi:hypothetical protein